MRSLYHSAPQRRTQNTVRIGTFLYVGQYFTSEPPYLPEWAIMQVDNSWWYFLE